MIEFLAQILAHMIWPAFCPVCGTPAKFLCEPCLRSLLKPQFSRCLWCGITMPCYIHSDSNAKIRAGSIYNGYMKDIILALKYGRYENIAIRLGKALADIFTCPDVDMLIPVPLHLKSKRRYNQAQAIAAGMGSVWGIKVQDVARWAVDTPSHARMNAAERMSLKSNVFKFNKNISGLRIYFVDDVCTTGSTLSNLAKAAKLYGAEPAGAFVAAYAAPTRKDTRGSE